MAHFAQLDENNVVLQVIVVDNKDTQTALGIEDEFVGIEFCKKLFGENTRWVQTSYNGTFRQRFAAIGGVYNQTHNCFINPRPFPSWIFDNKVLDWVPPVAMPQDAKPYRWDEQSGSWVELI